MGILIGAKILILNSTGVRLFSTQWSTSEGTNFTIPGISGVATMLTWLLLMMIPVVCRKVKISISIIIMISVVLSASRGDLMKVGIYLIIAWMVVYGKQILKYKKNFLKIMLLVLVILIIFGVWGNYRQKMRGWTSTTIGSLLESRTDNEIINWTFGYTGINFDVLKQIYIEEEKEYEFKALLVPIVRLVGGNTSVVSYYESLETHGINGFNAGTFLAVFIRELGCLYFIDIILLGSLVGILNQLCIIVNFKGGRIFLITQTALAFFGNYYLNVNMFFSLIVGILFHLFFRFEKGIVTY